MPCRCKKAAVPSGVWHSFSKPRHCVFSVQSDVFCGCHTRGVAGLCQRVVSLKLSRSYSGSFGIWTRRRYQAAVEAATVTGDKDLCTIVMDDVTHRELWTLFNKLDQDRSGIITLADFVSLGEQRHGIVSPQFSALVSKFDADGDGEITRAEWLQAFRKLMLDVPNGIPLDEIVKRHLAPGQPMDTVRWLFGGFLHPSLSDNSHRRC